MRWLKSDLGPIMKGDVISDHFLMLWFQKDSMDTAGFRTYGGGSRVLNPKVTFWVLNVPMTWCLLIYLWTLKLAFQLRSPNISIPNQILTLRKPIAYPLIGKIKKVEGAFTWATSKAISKSLYENSLWKTLNRCHGSPGMSPNGESNFPQLELGQEPITCPLHVFASGNINICWN